MSLRSPLLVSGAPLLGQVCSYFSTCDCFFLSSSSFLLLTAFAVNSQAFVSSSPEPRYCHVPSTHPPWKLLLLQLQGPKTHLQPCFAGLISAAPPDASPEHPLQEHARNLHAWPGSGAVQGLPSSTLLPKCHSPREVSKHTLGLPWVTEPTTCRRV